MMILAYLVAAVVATEPTPATQPIAAPAPAAEKGGCCAKMAKGEGCSCCKGMGKEGDSKAMNHGAGEHHD
jgi:hypothetical protein